MAGGPPAGLVKRHGLQGPIDDALMDSFVFVTPTIIDPAGNKVQVRVDDPLPYDPNQISKKPAQADRKD